MEKIEADLATAGPAKKLHVHRRAELIRGLLANSVTKIGFEADPPSVNQR